MSNTDDKQTENDIVNSVWNQGDQDHPGRQLISADFINHLPDGTDESFQEFNRRVERFKSAFPDLKITVEQAIAEDGMVADRTRVRGTHLGWLGALPPTGRKIDVCGFNFNRVERGQRVEGWSLLDYYTLYQQLGTPIIPG